MSENNQENQNSEKKEEIKEEAQEEKPKAKFTFKCTRCDACCGARGPIPLTFWDLEMWARNSIAIQDTFDYAPENWQDQLLMRVLGYGSQAAQGHPE